MNTVEIYTAQHVKIEFETAGIARRMFAFATDLLFMAAVFGVFFISVQSQTRFQSDLLLQFTAFIWFGFYSLLSESIGNGQSLGKWAMGIKVIKINGEPLGFYDCFSRWSTRLLEIYMTFGSVAAIGITGSPSGQRIGDMIAGTCVIRNRSGHGFRLNDILKLGEKTKENYAFAYPHVNRLGENDVLLIKKLLGRYKRYPNKAHKEAVELMAGKLKVILEIREIPQNKVDFFNTVISEYIIISR